MPDLPGAVPHLTYGYATFSPVVIAEQLKAARAARKDASPMAPPAIDTKAIADRYDFTRDDLWRGTVFPATDAAGRRHQPGDLVTVRIDEVRAFSLSGQPLD